MWGEFPIDWLSLYFLLVIKARLESKNMCKFHTLVHMHAFMYMYTMPMLKIKCPDTQQKYILIRNEHFCSDIRQR